MSDIYDAAVEVREAVNALTEQIKLCRLALLAISSQIGDVIDPGAGERFPGYVRVRIHNQEER